MWRIIMTTWIVTIICSTVSCRVAKLDDNLTTSAHEEETKYDALPRPGSCTNCGSNPSISSVQMKEVHEQVFHDEFSSYAQNKTSFKREISESTQSTTDKLTPAWCTPVDHVFSFIEIEPAGSLYHYFPPCTLIKRCGGCCSEEMHSCQPKNKTTRKFNVQKIHRIRRTIQSVEIPVEEHLSCECGCAVKSDSCTPRIQKYNENKCRCDCINTNDRITCNHQKNTRWNAQTCTCECRPDTQEVCTSEIDKSTCSCEN